MPAGAVHVFAESHLEARRDEAVAYIKRLGDGKASCAHAGVVYFEEGICTADAAATLRRTYGVEAVPFEDFRANHTAGAMLLLRYLAYDRAVRFARQYPNRRNCAELLGHAAEHGASLRAASGSRADDVDVSLAWNAQNLVSKISEYVSEGYPDEVLVPFERAVGAWAELPATAMRDVLEHALSFLNLLESEDVFDTVRLFEQVDERRAVAGVDPIGVEPKAGSASSLLELCTELDPVELNRAAGDWYRFANISREIHMAFAVLNADIQHAVVRVGSFHATESSVFLNELIAFDYDVEVL